MFKNRNSKLALPIVLAMALLMILAAPVSAQAEVPPAPELPADLGTEEVLPPLPEPEFIPPPPTPEVIPPPDLSGLAQALADEQLLLADEKGELLSMAEQEVVHSTDPWFRVGTLIYRYATDCTGLDNCTQSDAPIQTALNAIQGGLLPTDRTLYIDTGSFDEASVVLDGTLSPNLAMMTRILGEGMDNTVLNTDLTINNTINGFTVSGLTINGKLYMHHNRGTLNLTNVAVSNDEGDGVVIEQHTGAIVATNLKANGSLGNGAMLENLLVIAPVTVTGSTFDYNNDGDDENGAWVTGLTVQSRGPVTLNGVSASYNNGSGAFIDTKGGVTVRNSLFNENKDLNNDDDRIKGVGLQVSFTSAGNILIENSLANDNGTAGMRLFTTGNITLNQVTANGNEGSGLVIRNDIENIDDGGWWGPGAGLLTINYGVFNNNWANGLVGLTRSGVNLSRIYASNNSYDSILIRTPGNILLNSVEANDNSNGNGAYLVNQLPGAAGTVTLLDTYFKNQFSRNAYDGLYIASNNTINLRNVEAHDNSGSGLTLNNNVVGRAGAVTLQTVSGSYNGLYGVQINSRGAVSWTNGYARSNGWNASEETILNPDNVLIDNSQAVSLQQVTISRVSISRSNNGNGLVILTRGAVTLTDVPSNNNQGGHGVSINNLLGSGAVRITSTVENLNGLSFNNNAGYGLSIYANGAVTLAGLYASNNDGYGAYIDSSSASGLFPVTMTNVGFYNNHHTGLYVVSRGAITITNIDSADNNNWDDEFTNEGIGGVYLDNTAGSGAVSILRTITKWHNWISNNEGTGLEIRAKGPITLVRIGASNNQAGGVYVDNCLWDDTLGLCLGSGGVAVNNAVGYHSFFNDNAWSGLFVQSKGAITASNISAENNGGYFGAYLDNWFPGASGGVTLLAYGDHTNSFNGNARTGLAVYSVGAINLTRISVERNDTWGVIIDNSFALTNQPVTINDARIFENHGNGLKIVSKGAVRLTDVQSSDNDVIYSSLPVGESVVERVTDWHQEGDTWTFDWTDVTQPLVIRVETDDGFDPILELVDELGNPVAASAVEGDGQYYQVTFNTLPAGYYEVTVRSINSDKSGGYVLYNNTTNDPPVEGNGAEGLVVHTSTTAGSLTITSTQYGNSSFSNNSATGLVANVRGAVTFRNVRVGDNGGWGAHIDNCYYVDGKCTGVGGFSTSGYTAFENNRYDGLTVYTTGAINMVDVDAIGNGGFGAYLSNDSGRAPVTITSIMARPGWYNGFDSNGSYGLRINSSGAISLNRVGVTNNGTYGLYASNTTALLPAAVTINNSFFNNNHDGTGATAYSHGLITLNTVTASGNKTYGAYLNNNYAGFTSGVTILKSIFNDSQESDGLSVYSRGNILANGISAQNNQRTGVFLGNDGEGALGTITMLNTLGQNSFYDNGTNGLVLFSNRAITATGISLGRNGFGTTSQVLPFITQSKQAGITLRNVLSEYNKQTGVLAWAYGPVLFDRVYSYYNGLGTTSGTWEDGANISSQFGNVTLLNSAFAGNDGSGYRININMPTYKLFVTNTTAYANDHDGSGDPEANVY